MADIKTTITSMDSSKELAQETKELMETLYLLAEQKADIFLMETMNSINNKDDRKLPVTVLVDQEKTIYALAKKDSENIEKIISELLEKSNKKSILNKVKDSIVIALKSFLGASVAKSDSMEKYFILIDGYSAVRLDIKCWFHSVESTSLYNFCEKIVCLVTTNSIVDLSKIDISTFMYFYQTQLITSGIKGAELEEEMENVRKIYNKFKQSMND